MPRGDVWHNTIDHAEFVVDVTRNDDNTAQLLLEVTETGEVLIDRTVNLIFGAPFGPDVSDVEEWKSECLDAIDAYRSARGAKP